MHRPAADLLWDAWCIASVIGIWPRFIEPRLLCTTQREVCIQGLPKSLTGLKILQFSDLHFHAAFSTFFLKKLQKRILSLCPDVIVFSGDFLCHAELADETRLAAFLKDLKARYGCYAVLGNHDYQRRIGLNQKGEYDIVENENGSLIEQGFRRLFSSLKICGHVTERTRGLSAHAGLAALLARSPFTLLHNECVQIPIGCAHLNICGLGEYSCGRSVPELAFENYDEKFPGVLLLHNPDGIPALKGFPGDVVLCGHTHGGQVNLPGLWKKFTLLEHPQFKSGLVHFAGKWVYINRGIGSIFPFRWFAPPELLLLTLV